MSNASKSGTGKSGAGSAAGKGAGKGGAKRAARERLAEERRRQAEAAKRKERLVRGGVAAAVVLAIVLVVAVVQFNRDRQEVEFPPSASEDSIGLVVGNTSGDVPTVDVHEDFQCPNCESFEEQGNGQLLQQLAGEDTIQLTYVIRSFLDANLGNDSSLRAGNAAACADEQGKFLEYHNQLFANSPAQEGDGWTDEQLLGFGSAIDLDAGEFETCVEDGRYDAYIRWSEREASAAGINSTPSMLINGEQPQSDDPNSLAPEFNDPAALLATLGVEAPAGAATTTPAPASGASTATPSPTG